MNLLTVDDLARDFQVSQRTIQRWMSKHQLPYLKIGLTGRCYFRPEEVESWLEMQRMNEAPAECGGKLMRLAR